MRSRTMLKSNLVEAEHSAREKGLLPSELVQLTSDPSNNKRFTLSLRRKERSAIGQNRKKHRKNIHLIIHFPTSEGVSKVSKVSE